MRRRLALFGLVLGFAAPAHAAVTFVFSGHGWGHGIGLSQYGALGYAQHGASYTDILSHYYPGTQLGASGVSRIRVLLAQTKTLVRVSSPATFSVLDGAGQTHRLAAGDYTFGKGLLLKLDGVTQTQLPSPLVFSPGSSALQLNGKTYRGTLAASSDGKTLLVVNTLSLESYLYGVVPSEMPYFWEPEALKAQAIAARSYALATRQPSGPFDVFADTRSQVDGGVAAEHAETSQAVDATKGTVLLYNGKVATAYFYSTSGGKTAAIQDEWPKAQSVPYLVSVPDPYDALSPYHDWGPVPLTGAKIGTLLKAPGAVTDLAPTPNASGRVGQVTVTATQGTLTVTGAALRTALGLRSTWFSVGQLALTPTATTLTYGLPLQLSAFAKGLSGAPVLEQHLTAQPWTPVTLPAPGSDGAYALSLQPQATTWFRLTVGTASTNVKVAVAPAVSLQDAPAVLSGTVDPVVDGEAVDLQRQDGTAWTSVASATVAADGSFSAPVDLQPGAYRAVVAPSGGLVAGVSPVLVLPGP